MAALCVFLAAACGFDYKKKRIPNGLLALEALSGAAECLYGSGFPGVSVFVGKALLVTALLYPLFRIGTLGAGDVKLFGVTAGYLPFGKILTFLFFSLLTAAVISLIKMWKEKSFRGRAARLWGYGEDVIKNGRGKLYPVEEQGARVCLSGPVLISALLCWGGAY